MSEENVHKQKFDIAQWPTSKVILYPTRATIFRSIQGVQLKTGLNEVTIPDLTSLADPDSIRVSGTIDGHQARINDLLIDLIPNKFAHRLTHIDVDSDDEDDEDEDEPETLTSAWDECNRLSAERQKVEERKSLAVQKLSFVEQYAKTLSTSSSEKADPATMKSALDMYTNQRKAHFDDVTECQEELDKLVKETEKAQKILQKELKKYERLSLPRIEAKERKKIEKEEKQREKKEAKPEASVKVHRVRIIIDIPSQDASEGAKEGNAVQSAELSLTYTTGSASWTPHYDLRLDTTDPSLSTLTYRAHFLNRTYETWTNARITLSTSEASFGGLNEKIPRMESWRAILQKRYQGGQQGEDGLYSLAEKAVKQDAKQILQVLERGENINELSAKQTALVAASTQFQKQSGPWKKFGSLGAGGSHPTPKPISRSSSLALWASAPSDHRMEAEESERDIDGATIAPSGNFVAHSIAGLDTYGFTTTYDLPTPRTIPSSTLVRRHIIAEIPLPSLIFTYILIPKLKPAAFLKAKLTNTSDIPLLPGAAGLTLDGSFLGNLSFPRASPEETVVLELGVDQGLKVEYERPTVKHSTQGMMGFGKEEVQNYKRMMRLTNTKSASVSVVVLDQIPVPENEKLKVVILHPRGLAEENDVVKSGVGVDGRDNAARKKQKTVDHVPVPTASSSKLEGVGETGGTHVPEPKSSVAAVASRGTGWGTAKATLRKHGEVRWDVDLVKGGCVALSLEWECRMPSGECVRALS